MTSYNFNIVNQGWETYLLSWTAKIN